MKIKVIHKGFLIVALPLVVELLIIGSLLAILLVTDKEQEKVSRGNERSRAAARLILSDFEVAWNLVCAWAERNDQRLDTMEQALGESCTIVRELRSMPLMDEQLARMQAATLNLQDQILDNFKRSLQVGRNGLNLINFQNMKPLQKVIVRDLNSSTFRSMKRVHDRVEETIDRQRRRLRTLNEQAGWVLAAGVLLNIIAATALSWFFRHTFSKRIEVIRENARLLAEGKAPARVLSGTDEISEFDASFHSMHEQLELAAAKERALFENSGDLICVLSEYLSFQRVNNASLELLGYTPESLVGMTLDQLLPAAELLQCKAALQEGKTLKRPVLFELELTQASGVSTRTQWSAVWSAAQNVWYVIAHDVTEQRRMEALKRTFTQLLTSDFRLPLKKISSLLESLLPEFTELPAAEKKVQSLAKTMSRLVLLVDKLLELDRIDAPAMEIRKSRHLARRIIDESVNDLSESAAAKAIQILVQCPVTLSCNVDAASIVRVLVNLLSNAIKFSPENTSIIVEAKRKDNCLRFSVSDQGAGIAAETIARLFKPYQQSSAADGQRGKGTGLGLLICKQVAEQHGGEVGVDSELGKGSEFWFEIPIDTGDTEHETLATSSRFMALTAPVSSQLVSARELSAESANSGPTSLGGKISLNKKMIMLIGTPLLFEIIFIALMTLLIVRANAELTEQFRQLDLSSTSTTLMMNWYATAFKTLPLNRKELTPEYRKETTIQLHQRFDQFSRLARLDQVAAGYVAPIKDYLDKFEVELNRLEDVSDNSTNPTENQAMWFTSKANEQWKQLLPQLARRESQSPAIRRATRQTENLLLLGGIASNISLAVLLALYFSKDISNRFLLLSDNTKRLVEGSQLNQRMIGTDEICQLDASFHEMAKRLKETREKESAFLNNSQEIIFSMSKDARITAINSAVETLLGMTPASMLEKCLFDFVSGDELSALENALSSAREKQGTQKLELNVSELVVLLSVTWSSQEEAFFCLAHDLRKQKESEQVKREFISVITHDLRSPLSAIIFSVKLFEAGALGQIPEPQLKDLSEIYSTCLQVVELINDLLDLEKLSAGQMRLEMVNEDLATVISESVEFLKALPSSADSLKPIDIKVVCDAARINADLDRLPRAIMELLRVCASLDSSKTKLSIDAAASLATLEILCADSHANELNTRKVIESINQPYDLDLDPNKTGRLRIPLAIQVINAHGATIETQINRSGNLSLLLKFPLLKNSSTIPSEA